jgi:hypothetical protein
MKPNHRTSGLATASALALALAAAGCGDGNRSVLTPTALPPAPAPAASFTVSGTITETTDAGEVPVEGATITSAEMEATASTDSDGFYTLTGLRSGMALFIIFKAGYEERAVEMMIEGDSQLDAVLVRQAETN